MKLRFIAHGLICVSFGVAVLILAGGCANEAANQSQVHGDKTSGTTTETKIKTFKVRIHYLQALKSFVQVKNDVVGTISIDLENNQILWDQEPLELVNLHESIAGQTVFFDRGQRVFITGESGDGKKAVGLNRGAPINGQPFIQVCQTPDGSYDEFRSYFDQLKFPKHYYGLVAKVKYIDGTSIEISYKLVGSIQLLEKECLLNEKPANFHRSKLENGNGVIVINNGEDNLVLWPDGNWIFSGSTNVSDGFGGVEPSLKETYSDLRQRTEVPK